MKKFKLLTILSALLCLCFLPTLLPRSNSAFAENLVQDKYYEFIDPVAVFAGDKLTVVADGNVYAVDYSFAPSSVVTLGHGASKAQYVDGKFVYLYEKSLFIDGDEIATSVIDFDCKNGKILYSTESYVSVFDIPTMHEDKTNVSFKFYSVAIGDKYYLATKQNSRTDIYSLGDGLTVVSTQNKNFDFLSYESLSSTDLNQKQLIGLTDDSYYDFTSFNKVHDDSESLTVHGGAFYFLSCGNVYKVKDGVTTFEIGRSPVLFYPTSVVSNVFGTYIIDQNGLYSYPTFEQIDNTRYSAIASDGLNIYLAKGKDVLVSGQTVATYTDDVMLLDVNRNGDIFALLSSGKLYKNADYVCDAQLFAISKLNENVYTYSQNSFFLGSTKLFDASPVSSFDVDDEGNIFALTEGNVVRYSSDGNVVAAFDTGFSDPSLVRISRDNSSGQAFVVNKNGNNISKIDVFARIYTSEEVIEANFDENCVRTVASADVYSDFCFTEKIATLTDSNVICLEYDLTSNGFFSYVAVVDDQVKLGYVKKSALSSPVSLVPPFEGEAKTNVNELKISLLPFDSTLSPNHTVATISQKGTTINLLGSIVFSGQKWYKIEYNGIKGYTLSSLVKIGNYDPVFMPKNNATVKDDTQLFALTDSGYTVVGNIPQNAKIQVVGKFDVSKEYTQINYYSEDAGGTISCYVLTSTISYNGSSIQQQVAIIVIVILAVSCIVAVVYFVGKSRIS